MIFLVAIVAALVLFRLSDSIWPLYLMICLGIIHLYSIIFSRGSTLSSAARWFAVIAILWTLWVVGDRAADYYGPTSLIGRVWPNLYNIFHDLLVYQVPLVLWLAAVVWAVLLGRTKSLAGIRFLGTGAFVFGLWGVWGLLIQQSVSQLSMIALYAQGLIASTIQVDRVY